MSKRHFKPGDLIIIMPGANLHESGSPRPPTWKTVFFQTNPQTALVLGVHRSGPFVDDEDERGPEVIIFTNDARTFYVNDTFITHHDTFDGEVLSYKPHFWG